MQYVCGLCRRTYPIETTRFQCECGGLFHVDYVKAPIDFSRLESAVVAPSLWRYASALPPISSKAITRTTMGEGSTPLISVGSQVWGKADYYMPTLSFKDRGAAVLVALMCDLGVQNCVVDSSGNAGTAIAAYSTRVGIDCDVFVPAHTSDKKVEQIIAHGATVHKIEGSREDTADAALHFVKETGSYYASHIYNPFFWEGTKTYLYEIYETLGCLPEALVLPVGNGTLLMGVSIALKEFRQWGIIETYPKVVAVQAANCAPLAAAFLAGSLEIHQVPTAPTMAEGIASAAPARGSEILQMMKELGGSFVTVQENDILDARNALAKKGVYVELTSAANYAGYLCALDSGLLDTQETTVLPFCGAGLKSSH
ncbi:pyridoxal-phosphate dependent enzyme [Pleomorphochaeta sp. DL1XJH-081]|uniref:pyridoxal-phosphate dependent enzyme n=1 Tax=Pleomorphochaeta sp. DL1XJH-081 TaxID=3409690 RepID=UPI003BB7B614